MMEMTNKIPEEVVCIYKMGMNSSLLIVNFKIHTHSNMEVEYLPVILIN